MDNKQTEGTSAHNNRDPRAPEIKKGQEYTKNEKQPEQEPNRHKPEIEKLPNEIYDEQLPPDTRVVGNQ